MELRAVALVCGRADCTVSETGKCLLEYDPEACPERTVGGDESEGNGPEKENFPPSRACTLSDARTLMTQDYVRMVGVLGEPDAGKTACLVSLYLLLGRNRLEGFGFAGSTTLRGFEEISRGARRWDRAHPPEELTDRTELTGDRSASFLHLRLARTGGSGDPVELLMSDLPGEWTTELITKRRVGRLAFLKRADVIWLVVDGRRLEQPETRQLSERRMKLVVARLGTYLGETKPRLLLVITRRDQGALDAERLTELRGVGEEAGFDVEVVEVASFAEETADVEPGHGIGVLIEETTRSSEEQHMLWPEEVADETFVLPKIGLTRSG